jgi:hypothetical protein
MLQFTPETMAFLTELELPSGYSNVSLDQINKLMKSYADAGVDLSCIPEINEVISGLSLLLSALKPSSLTVKGDSILTAYSEQGVIKRVYGPSIYKGESRETPLILKFGDNTYSVDYSTEGKIVCGTVTGSISITEGKLDSGKKWIKACAELFQAQKEMPKPGEAVLGWEIPLQLNTEEYEINKTNFGAALTVIGKEADPSFALAAWLKTPSEAWIDLRTLPVGEYLCTEIKENKVHPQFGRSWQFNLRGVGVVNSRGATLEKQLATSSKVLAAIAAKKGITFKISSREEKTEGGITKVIIVSGFFPTRHPNPEFDVVNRKTLKSATPMQTGSNADEISATHGQQEEVRTIDVSASGLTPKKMPDGTEDELIPF